LSTGDIYDKTLEAVQALGLDSECVGGGRIKHDAATKKILVYGYSQVKLQEIRSRAVWCCYDNCNSADI
jgi:hypothetical protein